jgi:GT2 family glycosyltransferase
MTEIEEHPPIIVVDNASFDSTASQVRKHYPQVQLISLRHNMGAAGRNIGVQHVTTPYVAFCDDDTWWESGSLKRAADLLDEYPDIAVLSARVLVGPEEKIDPTCLTMADSPLPAYQLPGPSLLGFLAGASVLRKQAFLDSGGFEPNFFIGDEEALLTLDLVAKGWKIVYADQLTVHHYPSNQRDNHGRGKYSIRNALWVAWLRLPFVLAIKQSLRILRAAHRNKLLLSGLLSAIRALPWIISRRRVIPANVVQLYRMVYD